MSEGKKYVLELSAEELRAYCNMSFAGGDPAGSTMSEKLYALKRQAKADREADQLRLPWSSDHQSGHMATLHWTNPPGVMGYAVLPTPEMARLASAAPELLEAVKRVKYYWASASADSIWSSEVLPLIERALYKVETGITEEV